MKRFSAPAGVYADPSRPQNDDESDSSSLSDGSKKVKTAQSFESLFNSESLSDIVLDINGGEFIFYAHKMIIGLKSERLAALITNVLTALPPIPSPVEDNKQQNNAEEFYGGTPILFLQEPSECSAVFSRFLYFIYSGAVWLHRDYVVPLFKLSVKYGVAALAAHCENYIVQILTKMLQLDASAPLTQSLVLSSVGDLYEEPGYKEETKDVAFQVLCKRFGDFVRTDRWITSLWTTVRDLLRADECTSEENLILVTATDWMKRNKLQDKALIQEILSSIRYPRLPRRVLYQLHATSSFKKFPPVQNLIDAAIRYHCFKDVPEAQSEFTGFQYRARGENGGSNNNNNVGDIGHHENNTMCLRMVNNNNDDNNNNNHNHNHNNNAQDIHHHHTHNGHNVPNDVGMEEDSQNHEYLTSSTHTYLHNHHQSIHQRNAIDDEGEEHQTKIINHPQNNERTNFSKMNQHQNSNSPSQVCENRSIPLSTENTNPKTVKSTNETYNNTAPSPSPSSSSSSSSLSPHPHQPPSRPPPPPPLPARTKSSSTSPIGKGNMTSCCCYHHHHHPHHNIINFSKQQEQQNSFKQYNPHSENEFPINVANGSPKTGTLPHRRITNTTIPSSPSSSAILMSSLPLRQIRSRSEDRYQNRIEANSSPRQHPHAFLSSHTPTSSTFTPSVGAVSDGLTKNNAHTCSLQSENNSDNVSNPPPQFHQQNTISNAAPITNGEEMSPDDVILESYTGHITSFLPPQHPTPSSSSTSSSLSSSSSFSSASPMTKSPIAAVHPLVIRGGANLDTNNTTVINNSATVSITTDHTNDNDNSQQELHQSYNSSIHRLNNQNNTSTTPNSLRHHHHSSHRHHTNHQRHRQENRRRSHSRTRRQPSSAMDEDNKSDDNFEDVDNKVNARDNNRHRQNIPAPLHHAQSQNDNDNGNNDDDNAMICDDNDAVDNIEYNFIELSNNNKF